MSAALRDRAESSPNETFVAYRLRLIEKPSPYRGRYEIDSSTTAAELLRALISGTDLMVSGAIYLDEDRRLIGHHLVNLDHGFETDSCGACFAAAILANASQLLVFSTKRAGPPAPSQGDLSVSWQLSRAGEMLNLPVLDFLLLHRTGAFVSIGDGTRRLPFVSPSPIADQLPPPAWRAIFHRPRVLGTEFKLEIEYEQSPRMEPVMITCPRAAAGLLHSILGTPHREVLGLLFLDSRRIAYGYTLRAVGSRTRIRLDVAKLLAPALLVNAHSIIAFHNHPSGDPTPSWMDLDFTPRLNDAAQLLGINLDDHIVLGRPPAFTSCRDILSSS